MIRLNSTMTNPLQPIMHIVVKNDQAAMFELKNLATVLSEFGGQLRDEGHPQWWQLNDLLDDVIGLQQYLAERLFVSVPSSDAVHCHEIYDGEC